MDRKMIAKELIGAARELMGANLSDAYLPVYKARTYADRLKDQIRLTIRDNKDQTKLVKELDGILSLVEEAQKKLSKLENSMTR